MPDADVLAEWRGFVFELVKRVAGDSWVRFSYLCLSLERHPLTGVSDWKNEVATLLEEDDRYEEAGGYWRIAPEALQATPPIEVPF